MLQGIDSLNNLTSADEENIQQQIREYFEEMELDEEEIEKRIGLATDLEKGFRNLFILMLTAEIIGDSLESKRDDFVDFAYHDYTDAMVENGYSTDEYYSGLGYVEQYARKRCEEIVDTAILHRADNYYFSTDHSIAIGEDESNAVGNYQREQMAIAQGYTMKTWTTFHDDGVRHSHRLVDGQTISIFKPFNVGSGLMMFPMDVSLGISKREVYNCRCICEYSGKNNSREFDTDATTEALALSVATEEFLSKEDENRVENIENKAYDEIIEQYGTYGLNEEDFDTKENEALFWSGVGMENAEKYARSINRVTLEILERDRKLNLPEWSFVDTDSQNTWSVASAMYAKRAKGVVKVIINPPLRENNIWESIELKVLMENVNVSKIEIYDYNSMELIQEITK